MSDVSMKINDTWRARRMEDGCWYFYNKLTKESKWTFESEIGFTNLELDEKWKYEKQTEQLQGGISELVVLAPPSERAVKESEHLARARTYKNRHAILSEMECMSAPGDDRMVGRGPWVQSSLGINAAVESSLHTHVASALLCSTPMPRNATGDSARNAIGDSEEATQEWHRLLAAASVPDAVVQPEIRQMLAAASHVMPAEDNAGAYVDMTVLRTAIGEVLDAQYSDAARHIALYSDLLSKFPAASEQPLMPKPPAAALAASRLGSSAVRFASDATAASQATAASGPVELSLVTDDDAVSVAKSTGGQIANGKLRSLLLEGYNADVGKSLMLMTDPTEADSLRKVLCPLLKQPEWHATLFKLAKVEQNADDAFLKSILTVLVSSGLLRVVPDILYLESSSKVHISAMAAACLDIRSASDPVVQSLCTDESSALIVASFLESLIAQLQKTKAAKPTEMLGRALILSRIKQSVVYNHIAARSDAITTMSLIAPVAAAVLSGDTSTGEFVLNLPGVLQHFKKIKKISLQQYKELRTEFAIEEAFFAKCDELEKQNPLSTSDFEEADGSASAAEALATRIRLRNGCAQPISKSDVREIFTALCGLVDALVIVDPKTLDQFKQHEAQLVESIAAGDDVEQNMTQLHALRLVFAAVEQMVQLLSQPDVVFLCLHLLYHPAVAIDESILPASFSGADGLSRAQAGLRLLAQFCAWAIHRSQSRSFLLGAEPLSDSAIMWHTLVVQLSEHEDVAVQLLTDALESTSMALRKNDALDPVTALAATDDDAALSAFSRVVAESIKHAPIAAGTIHWMRNSLLPSSLVDDARFLGTCSVFLRTSVLLCSRWPLLTCNVLGLCHQAMIALSRLSSPSDMHRHRESVITTLCAIAQKGHAIPVVAYVRCHTSEWDLQYLRSFLNQMMASAISPYSLAFTVELAEAIAATQERIVQLNTVAGSDTSRLIASITINQKEKLVQFLRHVSGAFVRGVPQPLPPLVAQLRNALHKIEKQAAKVL